MDRDTWIFIGFITLALIFTMIVYFGFSTAIPIGTLIFLIIPSIWNCIVKKRSANYLGFTFNDIFKNVSLGVLIASISISFILIIELNFQIGSSIKDLMVKSRSPAFIFSENFPFPQSVFMFFIYNLLVQAFGEELFFRGFILKELLNRIGEHVAIIISALFFGVVHLPLLIIAPGLVSVFFVINSVLVGIIFAYIFVKRESLIPSWVAHTIANTFSFIFI